MPCSLQLAIIFARRLPGGWCSDLVWSIPIRCHTIHRGFTANYNRRNIDTTPIGYYDLVIGLVEDTRDLHRALHNDWESRPFLPGDKLDAGNCSIPFVQSYQTKVSAGRASFSAEIARTSPLSWTPKTSTLLHLMRTGLSFPANVHTLCSKSMTPSE